MLTAGAKTSPGHGEGVEHGRAVNVSALQTSAFACLLVRDAPCRMSSAPTADTECPNLADHGHRIEQCVALDISAIQSQRYTTVVGE
jgi:hypothetical protein